MTLQQIKRYPVLQAKIKRLEREIKKDIPESTYCGSVMTSNGPGYSQREERVSAVDTRSAAFLKIAKKQQQIDDATFEIKAIDDFVEAIEDIRIQEIITRKYLNGKVEWKEVAAELDETEAAIKMAVKRFFS